MATVQYELKETLLRVEGINLSYGDRPVLRDVNIEIKNIVRPGVKQGQVVALLGPSGMGKTCLFRILAGLSAPDSGRVLVNADQTEVQRGMVGVVAQNYPLFAHRTVMGNLMVAASDGPDKKKKALGLLDRFGLAEHASKYPVQLSGGQRQRVAIAQQFMCSEHFLLMDEPFSGLDVVALQEVIKFIEEMAQSDELKTFIVVTHDISSALEVADTIWVLGRDRDGEGKPIPGARIQKSYNLIDCGLAYQEGISTMPEYLALRQEIRDLFQRL
ncbi:MAG TPA: ATP-binding cassette domain-containing protein [Capsulimonadaceae bacterium]|jgi:polar amino acid transport system ATP-binding protein/sulfate transport system ATP-binding protein